MNRLGPLVGIAFLLSACGEPEVAEVPSPVEPTRDAIGYYCSMTVVDHPGPKGQIHLAGKTQPVWFSSVRDTVAFTMLPEEPKDITAIYVNDMGRAKTWARPEAGTWLRARDAWYVVGSSRRGGMGAPEPVPFGNQDAARTFAGEHGGRVVAFIDIPRAAILGTEDAETADKRAAMPSAADGQAEHLHGGHKH